MDSSVFDTEAFMNQESDASLDTKYPKAPESDYTAIIDKAVPRAVEVKNKETGAMEKGLVLDCLYSLMDDATHNIAEIKESIGAPADQPLIVKGGIFLDVDWTVTPPKINVGTGVNVRLGQLLESIGLNAGSPWNFRMFQGAGPLVVRVRKKANDNDPEDPYVNVTRTAALGA